jgi:hypothetical protein
MKKTNDEFEKFNRMMTSLVQVPHSEIKAKLDAEKAQKAKKAKKANGKKKTDDK